MKKNEKKKKNKASTPWGHWNIILPASKPIGSLLPFVATWFRSLGHQSSLSAGAELATTSCFQTSQNQCRSLGLWLKLPFFICSAEKKLFFWAWMYISAGLPWWLSSKEFCHPCRRLGFTPWVRKIPWRRKWQPTPVFLPGKSYGQRSLGGYSPWGCKRVKHNLATKQQQYMLVTYI